MIKSDLKTKFMTIFILLAFVLFTCPFSAAGAQDETGILTGHIYYQDGTSPVKGAVVKVRTADSQDEYESAPTDKQGSFRIDALPPGLYVAGIIYKDDSYSVDNPIGIKLDEPVDVVLLIGKNRPSPLWAFFTSTAGVAVLAAATAGATFGVVQYRNRNQQGQEISPFK